MPDDSKDAAAPGMDAGASLWRRTAGKPEGKALLAGLLVLLAYAVAVGLTALHDGDMFHSLWRMSVTHVLAGRAAGLSWGYAHNLPHWMVVAANMVIETFVVLIAFPLFVFSYERLIVIRPLEDAIARARRAAQAHQKTLVKYGAPGLLLFVWFPFWMTGPVVGSIIGFLIGLKLVVNLCVVLAGTYLAILGWGIVLKGLNAKLETLGPYVPFVFVGAVLLVAVSIHVRYAFGSHHAHEEELGPPGGP